MYANPIVIQIHVVFAFHEIPKFITKNNSYYSIIRRKY